ncbi:hypothetical protein [Sodalis sp.]|uniref:hypothetical protein n=1 Tax=Sodalis sp. (in: enterobacteria) TaxID=1898979 RepID=UPI0038737332
MLFLISAFGLNFPIFLISTKVVNVFHTDARGFGMLSSIMAIGTLSSILLAVGGGVAEWRYGIWIRLFTGRRTGRVALIIIGAAALTLRLPLPPIA